MYVANQLGVQPFQTGKIFLSPFEAQTSKTSPPSCHCFYHHPYWTTNPLQVLVVHEIVTPLQIPLRQQINDMPHLKNLTLAHPIMVEEKFCISLLIGADYYWDVLTRTIILNETAPHTKSGIHLIIDPSCYSSLT